MTRGKRVLASFLGNSKKQVSSITDLFYLVSIRTPKPKWGFVVDLRQNYPQERVVLFATSPDLNCIRFGVALNRMEYPAAVAVVLILRKMAGKI